MYLGIEIGGTKLQVGVGAGDGKLLALRRESVNAAAAADGIRKQILDAVPQLLSDAKLDRAQIRGVGIGFGGPVDDATRRVIKSHQIAGWDDFPLADWISDLLGWPVVLGNDADVAGLAEALFGAGKGLSPIFYITIGSGIGGGLILDGEVYRGCGRGAAEIGHLIVALSLSKGVLEQAASGWAIEREARRKLNLATVADVARAARAGNQGALSVLYDAWNHLAFAINCVIMLLCPRRIVIGGGVSLIGEDLLFEPLRRAVGAQYFAPFAGCCDIVSAALGEEVVVHGALALAARKLA